MARLAVEDGIRTVVASPHTLNEIYYNPADVVSAQVQRLKEIFLSEQIELELCPGAEMHICLKMLKRILDKEVATINENGSYVLVEFPVQTIPSGSRK